MFANCQLGGTDTSGPPDVCLTPSPAGPVPVPYPNVGAGPVSGSFVANVLFGGGPAHNLGTMEAVTNGDNAGTGGGVASGTCMGTSRHVTGANTVLVGGMPATRMSSQTMQNGTNTTGMRASPSQTTVLLLA